MDEGAFVLDYNMPVGTSLAQTDRVLRRVEEVLLETPDISGYIRRTGAELGFFATESYTGDILVSLKPPGERRPVTEIFDALREELEDEVPELETEFVPLVQDQISDLAGVAEPDRGQGLRPRPREAPRAGRAGRQDRRGSPRARSTSTRTSCSGNPDIVVRPDSVQTARVGLTELDVESQLNAALYGQVASTIPEQDRMTKIRVRYPDRVRFDRENLGQLPISLAMATPAAPARPRAAAAPRGSASCRWSQLASIQVGAQPQRALAGEPAAGHHRDRRARRRRPRLRSTASSTRSSRP